MRNERGSFAAIVVGLGIAVAGWFVGHGFVEGREPVRLVSVKGVSERDVEADIALWPIRFVATSDDLKAAQADIKKSHELVLAFLARHAIDPTLAEIQALEVTDRLADPYRSGEAQSRYIIAQTVMVRTTDPESVSAASRAVGELVDGGVVLSSQGMYGAGTPTYLFTRVNDLKPEMIAEATAEARRSAEQFAKDSGSAIGRIHRASQGVFVILPRDRAMGASEESQLHKTLRVVSTIDYSLTD